MDKVEELEAAVGVFLGDGNHEAEVRFNHFLLGARRFTLSALHLVGQPAEFVNWHLSLFRQDGDLVAQILDFVAISLDEGLPSLARQPRDTVEPFRIGLGAEILLKEIGARHLGAGRHAQQPPLKRQQRLVVSVKFLHQLFDAEIVNPHVLNVADQLVVQLGEVLF